MEELIRFCRRSGGTHPPSCTILLQPCGALTALSLDGVGVLLFNHHLHRGHGSAFADPAGCSSYGARHATCTDKAPRERSTQTTPSRNLTVGGKEQKERKPQQTRSPRDPEGTSGKTDQRGNKRRRVWSVLRLKCPRWGLHPSRN